MNLDTDYIVKQISNSYASSLAIQHNFTHRKPNAIISYGLIDKKKGVVVGIVIYGNPVSPAVACICGDDEFYNVYDLSRIWIHNKLDKNITIPYIINKSINELDKEIIVTYCEDTQVDLIHAFKEVGFIYLGMTQERVDRGYVGEEVNTLLGKQIIKQNKHNMSAWYDKENTVEVIRTSKHRFIYFNCDENRKKELMLELKYRERSYPIEEV